MKKISKIRQKLQISHSDVISALCYVTMLLSLLLPSQHVLTIDYTSQGYNPKPDLDSCESQEKPVEFKRKGVVSV